MNFSFLTRLDAIVAFLLCDGHSPGGWGSALKATVEILRDMKVYYSHASHCGSNVTIDSVKII